jgi:hypothetical protein
MNQLPYAVLALRRVHFAVEILAHHDVRGQLAPRGGNFAVGLLEEDFAPFALDGRYAQAPFDRVKRIDHVFGTEQGVDDQPLTVRSLRVETRGIEPHFLFEIGQRFAGHARADSGHGTSSF